VDFTRQPIIETVITAKEGCKLVVRSSKGVGQEEYFVDAAEVVSFGNSFFFRSLEKPKSFLVPVTDYEILEVREARMVLKNVGFERAIKIGGGKETSHKNVKETEKPKAEPVASPTEVEEQVSVDTSGKGLDKKRDRRRSFRRRRRGEEGAEMERTEGDVNLIPPPPIEALSGQVSMRNGFKKSAEMEMNSTVIKSLLPPPTNLISETIEKYKDNKLFEGVFMNREKRANEETQGVSECENIDLSEEVEQGIVEHRKLHESSFVTEDQTHEENFRGSVFSEDFPGHGEEDENPFNDSKYDEEQSFDDEEDEDKEK